MWKLYEKIQEGKGGRKEEAKEEKYVRPQFVPLINKYVHTLDTIHLGKEHEDFKKKVEVVCEKIYKHLFSQPVATIVATALYLVGKKDKTILTRKMTLKNIALASAASSSSVKRSVKKLRQLKYAE